MQRAGRNHYAVRWEKCPMGFPKSAMARLRNPSNGFANPLKRFSKTFGRNAAGRRALPGRLSGKAFAGVVTHGVCFRINQQTKRGVKLLIPLPLWQKKDN